VLDALRALFTAVDAVSLALPGEERFADPAVRLIERAAPPRTLARVAMLRHGGAYFWDDHAGCLGQRLRAMVGAEELASSYDLVWCHSPLMARAATVVASPLRVLDIDNVPSADLRLLAHHDPPRLARNAYHRLLCAALRREERKRVDLHNAVTVTSELERERLGPVRPPVTVLRNSVPEARPAPVADSRARILFVGSLDYAPNVDAVSWLADEIAPRLRALTADVEISVVGRRPGAEVRSYCRRGGLTLVADAPSLVEHYRSARAVIAPMRIGGGTGRIKVLEALAHGMPIVATPQALDGLRLERGRDVLVAPDPDGLATHVCDLLRDGGLAARIGRAGREVWRRDHDPASARRAIEALVDRLSMA